MAHDPSIVTRPARLWRRSVLAAMTVLLLPGLLLAQSDGIFKDGFDPPLQLVINEVDYDQPGTDFEEFIEVYNGTSARVPLGGVHLLLFNGSTLAQYGDIDLGVAGALSASEYLVVADPAVFVPSGATVIRFGSESNNIQNGSPDGLLLIDTLFCRVFDAFCYEGAMAPVQVANCGMVNLVEGTAAPGADSNVMTASLARYPNGSDTGNAASDWIVSLTPTPGMENMP
jgi:hypothetical protein